MKKILLSFICLNIFSLNAFSALRWKNDTRELFKNNQLVIYEINPRTFGAKDINGNGIIEPEFGETFGNFISAIDRLDELKTLGINAIHVMPVTPVGTHKALGTAGSLYSISDFKSINPQFDVNENNLTVNQEFENFVYEAHLRNIRVIVDLPSCGSYDLYLKNPDLFYTKEDGELISPSDWLDVFLFKTLNDDNTLNEKLFEEHKAFIDMLLHAKVDGIRADVATIKPYEFWRKLISYARAYNTEFLFLAEASNAWTKPPCNECEFTTYDKLLQAGFDGYYGSYFNFKDWTKAKDLEKQVRLDEKLAIKYDERKSVIGSFSTHDELSPIIIGGEKFAKQIIWLNALLALNPYYVDGILSGDNYIYPYANKKAQKSYTDNDTYYVHKGKLDIFNFSRQPGGDLHQLKKEFERALKFRNFANYTITNGHFNIIKTSNDNVFAFERKSADSTILVILNINKNQREKVKIKYKNIFTVIESEILPEIKKNKISAVLEPSGIIVLYSERK